MKQSLLHQIVYSTLSTRIRHFFAPFARKIFLAVKKPTFIFRGKKYCYFDHSHNVTWKNERAVEIPIAVELLKKFIGKRILEIGDTLHHYTNINHDVVDKYEMNEPNVIRMDVIDYKPKKKYDLIISISTMEHVGWDEDARDPKKIPKAINQLLNLLSENGALFITLPYGYNPDLDPLIDTEKLFFEKMYYFQKQNIFNEWEEVKKSEIKNKNFDVFMMTPRLLVIGTVGKIFK